MLTNMQKMLGGLLLVLTLSGLGTGTIHNTATLRHAETAIVQVQEAVTENERRANEIERRLARIEALEEYEHPHRGPAGNCLCVDDSAEGPKYKHLICSLASECDDGAVKDCETLYPGFKCTPLVESGKIGSNGGGGSTGF